MRKTHLSNEHLKLVVSCVRYKKSFINLNILGENGCVAMPLVGDCEDNTRRKLMLED